MAYTVVENSIGSIGRDYATVTLWVASVPANLYTANGGDGTYIIGTMYNDSIFVESISDWGKTASHACGIILRAAPGQEYNGIEGAGVVWRSSGDGSQCIKVSGVNITIYGIEFDGVGQTTGANSLGLVANYWGLVVRCAAHDSKYDGFGGGYNNAGLFVSCVAYDNKEDGFTYLNGGGWCHNCGAYRNGANGFSDLQGAFSNCWSYSNTTADYSGTNYSYCCFSGDATVRAGFGNQASQLIADAKFTDAPNGNFTLLSGSNLLLQGTPLAGLQRGDSYYGAYMTSPAHWIDIKGLPLTSAPLGSRLDVGPEQYSYRMATQYADPGKAYVILTHDYLFAGVNQVAEFDVDAYETGRNTVPNLALIPTEATGGPATWLQLNVSRAGTKVFDLPALNKVAPSDTLEGVPGTLDLPAINKVAPSDTLEGVAGTLDLPSISSVDPADTLEGVTGTLDLPALSAVDPLDTLKGSAGTMDVPDIVSVLSTDTLRGVAGTYSNTIPTAPTFTIADDGAGDSATVTMDGDAGVTNYFYYRRDGELVWTLGGSRSGDGTIAVADLAAGLYHPMGFSGNGQSYSMPTAGAPFTIASVDGATPTNRMQAAVDRLMDVFQDEAGVLISYVRGGTRIRGITATVSRTPYEVMDGDVMIAHESRDYIIKKSDLSVVPQSGDRIIESDGRVYEVSAPRGFNVYELFGPTATVYKVHTVGPK